MPKIPPARWYKAMNMIYVTEQVEANPKAQETLKEHIDDFISWASEMMDYFGWLGFDYLMPQYFINPYDEIKGLKKRMYETDVKKWRQISKAVFERDNYTCTYCGIIGGDLEVDHIIPFSYSGNDDMKNLTTSCRKCNRQKKDKSIEEFLRWRENRKSVE